MRSNSWTHGHSPRGNHSETYKVWAGMKKRCYTPTMAAFKYYGGRGIRVCDRWMDFANFLADMGEKPPGKSLERVDNDGDYGPDNCRWATREEQIRNRRNTVLVTAFGSTNSIGEWAAQTGLPYNTIFQRVRKGVPHEEAVTRPWYSREHQKARSQK